MSNEVTIYNPEQNKEVVNGINAVIQQCVPIAESTALDMGLSLAWANGIKQMKAYIAKPEIMELIQGLKGSSLGFLTDKSYPDVIVAECCVHALLNGYRLIGNEFNIISGKFYPAKDGKYRKIIEHPGLSDFISNTAPPVYSIESRTDYNGNPTKEPIATVQCWASWKLNGKSQSIGYTANGEKSDLIFKIKAKGATDDNINGKALSKLYTKVLTILKGKSISDAEPDEPAFTSQAQTVTASVSVSEVSPTLAADDPDSIIIFYEKNSPDIFNAVKDLYFGDVPNAPAKRKEFAAKLKEMAKAADAAATSAETPVATPAPAGSDEIPIFTADELAEAKKIIAEYPEEIRFQAMAIEFPTIDKTNKPTKPEKIFQLAKKMKEIKLKQEQEAATEREPGMDG